MKFPSGLRYAGRIVFVFVSLLMLLSLAWPGVALASSQNDHAGCANSYQVQKGDTLSEIAVCHGVDAHALASANGIDNPDHIYVGQRLCIPDANQNSYGDQNGSGPNQGYYNRSSKDSWGNPVNYPDGQGSQANNQDHSGKNSYGQGNQSMGDPYGNSYGPQANNQDHSGKNSYDQGNQSMGNSHGNSYGPQANNQDHSGKNSYGQGNQSMGDSYGNSYGPQPKGQDKSGKNSYDSVCQSSGDGYGAQDGVFYLSTRDRWGNPIECPIGNGGGPNSDSHGSSSMGNPGMGNSGMNHNQGNGPYNSQR